ncbi:hypothetical protein DVH26_04780 [Paenibacillus sp. H1-7]|nr:hypothetical protein DVH26_04780 [Paenibacillus sp. H1-7]
MPSQKAYEEGFRKKVPRRVLCSLFKLHEVFSKQMHFVSVHVALESIVEAIRTVDPLFWQKWLYSQGDRTLDPLFRKKTRFLPVK